MRMASAIVIFDGECALCNGFVAWLVRHDSDATFLLAGSAGAAGKAALAAAGLRNEVAESTIVVWDGVTPRVRSRAVFFIASRLPWPWRAATAMRLIPARLADAVYDKVAARRGRVSSGDAACGVPPKDLETAWKSRLATPTQVRSLA